MREVRRRGRAEVVWLVQASATASDLHVTRMIDAADCVRLCISEE